MKQSRATSFLKSLISTVVGFAVAMVANALVLPLFGYTPTLAENVLITCIYTAISIARGYVLERFFEAMGWRVRISPFASAVLAERQRQQDVEGYSLAHDDEQPIGDLAAAGTTYVEHAIGTTRGDALACDQQRVIALLGWPWADHLFKPQGFRRDLVKGCALIIAEGEKADRNRKRKPA